MQPAAPDNQDLTNQYLNSLLQRHSSVVCQVQKAVKHHNDKIERKIQNGRYEIRQAEIPVVRKTTQSHQGQSLKQMIQIKKNLEGRLSLLEANLQHLNTKSPQTSTQLSEKQHEDFMKQIYKSNKQLLTKRMERRQVEERRSLDRQEEKRKQEQSLRIQKEKRKKEEVEDKIRRVSEAKQRRQKEIEAQNRVLSSIIQSKPLYEKIEEKYGQFQAMTLEQKKRKLAEIRNLHRPVTKQDIEAHEKKLDELKQRKLQQKQQRQKQSAEQQALTQNKLAEVYRSQWYNKILEEEKSQDAKLKESQQSNVQNAKQNREKLKQYSQYVKEKFKPEVDPLKSEQLREKQTEEKHQVKPEEARKMGLQYLKWSKEQINANKAVSQLNSTTSVVNSKPKPPNYLQELRKNRPTQNQGDIGKHLEQIMKKPLDQKQKAIKIIQHVNKIEQQAKRKQQLARAGGDVVDEQLDKLYLQSVKAKLALLS